MSLDWGKVENALQAWVKRASGLPDAFVIWANQDGPRPEDPFLALKLTGMRSLGAVDGTSVSFDPAAEHGKEIEIATRGERECALSIQCFNAEVLGNDSARAILSKVQAALALDSYRDFLSAGGVTVFDKGNIREVPAILSNGWEARGILEVRFYVVESVSDFTTYIETVEAKDTTTGHVTVIDS